MSGVAVWVVIFKLSWTEKTGCLQDVGLSSWQRTDRCGLPAALCSHTASPPVGTLCGCNINKKKKRKDCAQGSDEQDEAKASPTKQNLSEFLSSEMLTQTDGQNPSFWQKPFPKPEGPAGFLDALLSCAHLGVRECGWSVWRIKYEEYELCVSVAPLEHECPLLLYSSFTGLIKLLCMKENNCAYVKLFLSRVTSLSSQHCLTLRVCECVCDDNRLWYEFKSKDYTPEANGLNEPDLLLTVP